MNQAIDTSVGHVQQRGAPMEAHAGSITIGTGRAAKPRLRALSQLREAIGRRKSARAERAYATRMNGGRSDWVPGSEHTHLLKRPRGF
jgi:hypothetical protein